MSRVIEGVDIKPEVIIVRNEVNDLIKQINEQVEQIPDILAKQKQTLEYMKKRDDEIADRITSIQSAIIQQVIKATIAAVALIPVVGFPASLVASGVTTLTPSAMFALNSWYTATKSASVPLEGGGKVVVPGALTLTGDLAHDTRYKAQRAGVAVGDSGAACVQAELRKYIDDLTAVDSSDAKDFKAEEIKAEPDLATGGQRAKQRLYSLLERIKKMIASPDRSFLPFVVSQIYVKRPKTLLYDLEIYIKGSDKEMQQFIQKANFTEMKKQNSHLQAAVSRVYGRHAKKRINAIEELQAPQMCQYNDKEKALRRAKLITLQVYSNLLTENTDVGGGKLCNFIKKSELGNEAASFQNDWWVYGYKVNVVRKAMGKFINSRTDEESKLSENELLRKRQMFAWYIMCEIFTIHLGTPFPAIDVGGSKNKYRYLQALEDIFFLGLTQRLYCINMHPTNYCVDVHENALLSGPFDWYPSRLMCEHLHIGELGKIWCNAYKRAVAYLKKMNDDNKLVIRREFLDSIEYQDCTLSKFSGLMSQYYSDKLAGRKAYKINPIASPMGRPHTAKTPKIPGRMGRSSTGYANKRIGTCRTTDHLTLPKRELPASHFVTSAADVEWDIRSEGHSSIGAQSGYGDYLENQESGGTVDEAARRKAIAAIDENTLFILASLENRIIALKDRIDNMQHKDSLVTGMAESQKKNSQYKRLSRSKNCLQRKVNIQRTKGNRRRLGQPLINKAAQIMKSYNNQGMLPKI